MESKWGTWEELVLASAVKRHGTNDWESVAMELQARKLSSQDCKLKYHALQGRFTCSNSNSKPWFEELRNLRVAYLKRELERYDDSIVSLESKLKRLKTQSWVKEEHVEKEDLEQVDDGTNKLPQDLDLGKADLESANPTHDLGSQGVQLELPLRIPHNNRTSKSEVGVCGPASPLDSYYGSSDTIAKEHPHRTMASAAKEEDGREESFVESTDVHSETIVRPSFGRKGDGFQEGSAESREIGEEPGKGICEMNGDRKERPLQPPWDTSDVLSSAEFSTRRRRRREDDIHSHSHEDVGGHAKDGGDDSVGGQSSGEGTDDMSPMSKTSRREAKMPGKLLPLPLLECLRAISAHKFGSIFKHKLDSQDNLYYKSMIRRHMDLGMVRSRLDEGSYSGSVEFFRDVLLVFTNALVYYQKYSQEFVAAYVLRQLASKEMENIFQTEALLKQQGPSTRKGWELKPINQVGRPKTKTKSAQLTLDQQSSSSAVVAIQIHQSESGKRKEEGPKVTVTQHKTQDANARRQRKNRVRAKKALSPNFKKGINDLVASNKSSNQIMETKKRCINIVEKEKKKNNMEEQEANLNLNLNLPLPLPLLKRGVGRPPKHAKLRRRS